MTPPAYTVSNTNVIERDVLSDITRLDLLAPELGSTAITLLEPEQNLDITALEGLGAEIWQGVDPVAYIDQLRDDWDAD
jgi:hypothetical protein